MPGACVAKSSASRSLDGSASSVCESKTSPTALLPVRSDVASALTTTCLAVLAGRQRDRHDRLHRRQQPQVLQHFRPEAVARRGQRVAAGRQAIDSEGAVGGGRPAPRQPIRLVDDEDDDVGNRRVRAVPHLNLHRRRRGLRPARPGRRHQTDDDAQRQAERSADSLAHGRRGYFATMVPCMPAAKWPGNVQTNV